MARTKTESTPKGPPPGTQNNSLKSFESERIAAQIDAFEKSGGHIEKLGVTRYEPKPPAAKRTKSAPAAPAAPSGRPRVR